MKELIVEIQEEFESGLDQFKGLDELELEAEVESLKKKKRRSRDSISAGGIILILGLFAIIGGVITGVTFLFSNKKNLSLLKIYVLEKALFTTSRYF